MSLRASILLALAACGGVAAGPDPHATWSIDTTTSDGALLGVWGTGPDDVWAVGGTTGRALILHGDGRTWTRADVDAPAILFSVYGFTRTDVYAVGDGGLILHYDGVSWSRVASGTSEPLFGLWGASGDDVWIVGGNVAGSSGSAIVLRGTQHGFAPVQDIPETLMPNVVFKVHGFGPDSVILVGNEGVLRWDGTVWSRDPLPVSAPLYSAWGRNAQDCYAVGGQDMGEILHWDGAQWTQSFELPTGVGLRGVFSSVEDPTIAVGGNAMAFEIDRKGSVVEAELPDLGTNSFLHAVWGDGAGTTYVAGSDYPHATTGAILRRE